MADILTQLSQKEKKIRDLQQTQARQIGQREQLLSQLKTEFEVKSIDEALTKLESIQQEVERNNEELTQLDNQMGEIIAKAQPKN